MLLTIALALAYVEIKNSVLRKFFSAVVSEFWNEWELRTMVVSSQLLQLLLLCSGHIRRRYRGKCLTIFEAMVWSVYLLADWMATVVLSNILRGEATDQKNDLVLWISFILWHLGSPYNITAYTVEDNELWLRHLFGLLVQVGEAFYICIKFRSPITSLNFVATPIFIAGVLRYLERVFTLRSASKAQLRNCLISRRDTNGNAATIRASRVSCVVPSVTLFGEAELSHIILQPLLTQLPFGVDEEAHDDMVFTRSKSADEAFRLVGSELRFFHDLLYTKIPKRRSNKKLSFTLQIFGFLSVVSALVACTLINYQRLAAMRIRKTEYPDIAVTYSLLFELFFWKDMHFMLMLSRGPRKGTGRSFLKSGSTPG
ncbi:protein of unknown function DUF4220 - like 4 [Theobroma cacao]|nr:protein of unknown function DUF4220 - like 4 [Theobroma cacao]